MLDSARDSRITRTFVVLAIATTFSNAAYAQFDATDFDIWRVPLGTATPPLDTPVYMTSTFEKPQRLYVVEKAGRVRIIEHNELQPGFWLDVNLDLIASNNQVNTTGQNGLLSLAFHPQYSFNGRFFVAFSLGVMGGNCFPIPCETVVWEYKTNFVTGVPTLKGLIFKATQTGGTVHGPGALRFLKDGSLIFGVGDGDFNPGGGQNPAQVLGSPEGKLHRFLTNEPGFTSLLPDNQFPMTAPTLWMLGLRNPYSFAVSQTDIWIADPGELTQEEVTLIALNAGSTPALVPNLEWDCMEGSVTGPGSPCPPPIPIGTCTPPTYSFAPLLPTAIIGGTINDGRLSGALRIGLVSYLFGDFNAGTISYIKSTNPGAAIPLLEGVGLPPVSVLSIGTMYGFGSDTGGASYLVIGQPAGGSGPGEIYEIIERCDGIDLPLCLLSAIVANTTGFKAELCAADLLGTNGNARLVADELRFTARNMPDNISATLYISPSAISPGTIGIGTDCIGIAPGGAATPILTIRTTNNRAVFDVNALGLGLQVNDIRYFQVLFTEGNGDMNTSSATRLTFI